jgi:hypothetical protein
MNRLPTSPHDAAFPSAPDSSGGLSKLELVAALLYAQSGRTGFDRVNSVRQAWTLLKLTEDYNGDQNEEDGRVRQVVGGAAG